MTGSRERRGATWPRVSTLIGHGGARRHTSLSTYGSFVSFPFWLVSFCRSLKGSQKRVIVMTYALLVIIWSPWTGRVARGCARAIHKQQTTIRKPIECAPEASSGGREWAEMTEGFHLEATRR